MTGAGHIVEHPSPNFTARRGGAVPDMVVLHYTGMESAAGALERLCDPAAEVSAHYLIDTDGTVLHLVPEEKRAWHAGVASWGGVDDVNSRSIGIELVNPGHVLGYPPFPHPQMAALEGLLPGIMARWSIRPARVVGHACVAPGRKIDPGEKFDWRRLACQGLSVWLDPVAVPDGPPDAARFQEAARRIGYAAPESGAWCEASFAVWQAFAMRFVPGAAHAAPSALGVAHAVRIADAFPATDGA